MFGSYITDTDCHLCICSDSVSRKESPGADTCSHNGCVFICSDMDVPYVQGVFLHRKQTDVQQIIEGVASYVKIPDGGKGLNVGCGSGALTIACAKRNLKASLTGLDGWGKEYASFSKNLCERNAKAEGVSNTRYHVKSQIR